MGYEVVKEQEFPCPCGEGKLVVQLKEHDTWVNGQSKHWHLVCAVCEPAYSHFSPNGLIRREAEAEICARMTELRAMKDRVGEKAVARYLPEFGTQVKRLRFRTDMFPILRREMEKIDRFRARTRTDEDLERAIEMGLRSKPAASLAFLKTADAELEADILKIQQAETELEQFIESQPEFKIPDI
jgi:hypothetical protein